MPLPYIWLDLDTVQVEHSLGGVASPIIFQANNISRERTGVHARLSILQGDATLAWTYTNVEHLEDRQRLSNKAHKLLGQVLREAYPATLMVQHLDIFCLGLWDAKLSQFQAEGMQAIDDSEAPPMLLAPFIPKDGGSIIFAPPGRGKSYIGKIMAVSIEHGVDSLWETSQAKALIINLERSRISIQRRLAGIYRALDLPVDSRILAVNARGLSLSDIAEGIKREISRHGVRFVLLDSISRASSGDLNEGKTAIMLMNLMNSLSVTWLAIAHTPRATDEHIIGSMQYDAAADITIQLLSQASNNGTLGIGLKMDKINDGPKAPLQILALEFDQWRLRGVRLSRGKEFPEIEAKRKDSLRDRLIEITLSDGMLTAREAAERLEMPGSRGNIAHLYASDDVFVKLKEEGSGRNKRYSYGVKSSQEGE